MTRFFSILLVGLLVIGPCEAQGVTKPQYPLLIGGDIPLYPTLAKTARVSGIVKVQVTVRDGNVVNAKLLSGHPLLATATTNNIETWKFDKATNATFTTTFLYELDKDEVSQASNPIIELQLPELVRIRAKPTKSPCQDCVDAWPGKN